MGSLVRGLGTGVRDAVHPPLPAQLDPTATAAGISINRANDAGITGNERFAEVFLAFSKPFQGALVLAAFDATGVELGVGRLPSPLNIPQAASETVRFAFTDSVRFSAATVFRLRTEAARTLIIHESAAGITASQLREQQQTVTLYVTFQNAFRGGIQLRAYDQSGQELGRSSGNAELERDADAAEHIDFPFDARVSLRYAAKYELWAKRAPAARSRGSKNGPAVRPR